MTNSDIVTVVASSELYDHAGAVLDDVASGEQFIVTRYGKPVAVIRPYVHAEAESPAWTAVRESQATYSSTGAADTPPPTALLRFIGSDTTRSIAAIFLQHPDEAFYQRQIARMADVALRSAQLALEHLEELGLISSERDGNRRYYRAVRSERFEALRELLARELAVADIIRRQLSALEDRIDWAFLFGSAATGEDTLESDIDLLVVGDVSDDELVEPIAQAQRELGRQIDVVSYRPDRFAEKRAQDNHFLSAILDQPRVDVIGEPDDA
jgi:predicted nucleotidyltransferase/antitoxin (DNA-binding transcriptional repressor) of toxin-antitoxin stability system